MAYIFNISKPFQIKYYVLNKRYTKVSLKTLLLQIFFAIMLMDTFENIRCFPFLLNLLKRKVVIFMTKREISLFLIILLLFVVVIILLLK